MTLYWQSLAPLLVNEHEDYYGSTSHQFDPSRWLKADESDGLTEAGKSPYAFLTFLAGPRNCIGQRFAVAEMKAILAILISNFEFFELNPGEVSPQPSEFGTDSWPVSLAHHQSSPNYNTTSTGLPQVACPPLWRVTHVVNLCSRVHVSRPILTWTGKSFQSVMLLTNMQPPMPLSG